MNHPSDAGFTVRASNVDTLYGHCRRIIRAKIGEKIIGGTVHRVTFLTCPICGVRWNSYSGREEPHA